MDYTTSMISKIAFFFNRSKEAAAIKHAIKTGKTADAEKIYSRLIESPHDYPWRCLKFLISRDFKIQVSKHNSAKDLSRITYAARWEYDRRISQIVRH